MANEVIKTGTKSSGDAAVDGLLAGLGAGIAMAAYLIVAGVLGGESPVLVLSRFCRRRDRDTVCRCHIAPGDFGDIRCSLWHVGTRAAPASSGLAERPCLRSCALHDRAIPDPAGYGFAFAGVFRSTLCRRTSCLRVGTRTAHSSQEIADTGRIASENCGNETRHYRSDLFPHSPSPRSSRHCDAACKTSSTAVFSAPNMMPNRPWQVLPPPPAMR